MRVCPHCGHDNAEADARFCASCGRPLPDAQDVSETPAESTGSLTALVHTVKGDEGEPAAARPAAPDEVTHGESSPTERLREGTALLVVRSGPAAGARFLLDAAVTTAGRHPDSDIFLDDITVSRRHVEFVRDDGRFRVHDVGSLNGTYVNRQRIDDAVLSNGDEVQIGKYRLAFLTGGEA